MHTHTLAKHYIALFAVLTLLFTLQRSFADTPVVTAFNVTPSIESGQVVNIGWTITGGGHSLLIFCSQGVKLRYNGKNQTFPCDTRISLSPFASDGVALLVANVSAGPRILTVRIIPKDGNGVNYDAGAKEATVYINPAREPINTIYTTSTTTISGVPTVVYWKSTYLDGVNMRIACNEYISATSSATGNATLPCGETIFPSDLPGSGSVSFQFNNRSATDQPLDVTVLPAMSPGVYNGARPSVLNLTVASDAQKPVSVSSFSASRKLIYSGDAVIFNWSLVNARGANLKLSCAPQVEFQVLSASKTTVLSCGEYGWSVPFKATASTSVVFINYGEQDQLITASLFPQLKDGNYDGATAANLRITLQPATKFSTSTAPKAASAPASSAAPILVATPITPVPLTSTVPASASPIQKPASAFIGKNVFTRPLDVGARGDDVRTLQIFLAKDNVIYPEGLITGFYGPRTAKAVGRFQLKYGLVQSAAEASYGFVGPRTRILLNSFYE